MLFCVLFEVFLYIAVMKMYSSDYKLHYFAFSKACKVTIGRSILQSVVAVSFIIAYSSVNDMSLIYRVEGQITDSLLLKHTLPGAHRVPSFTSPISTVSVLKW